MRINPAFLLAMLVAVASGCKSGGSDAPKGEKASHGLSKLVIEDPKVGTGDPVKIGDEVMVTYTGRLENGHVFDSNDKPGGKDFHFTVGAGNVIKGWDQGLVGMKTGGKRKLSIPAALAYGKKTQGDIPPNSDLYFDIELLSVLKQEDINTIKADDLKKGTGAEAKAGSTVTVDYVATASGKEFESQKNVRFKIGGGDIDIPGFDDAIVGMKVGGTRKITIPPAFTRSLRTPGQDGIGMSPAVFEVKLTKSE
jgi:FKBP-type peptidyl-prolyl cis-trans isomerase